VTASLFGAPIPRREDAALLTGHGTYIDDVTVPGLLHAFVVRSPLAHARITGIDVTAAHEAPGVAAVFTAGDLAGIGPVPGVAEPPPTSPALHSGDPGLPDFPVLASHKVLWAGHPIALVVAETPAMAADAADLVEVDYDPLPAVTGPEEALAPDAPVLYDGFTSNVCIRHRVTGGDAEAAFASAAHIVRQKMTSQRIAPVALEPRGVLAHEQDGRLHVRISTQRPHGTRRWLSAILGLPEEKIHVVVGDMGGGFGAKGPLYPDQIAVIAAARALGRPVKWIEERTESFLATTHGRDQVADLEMALDSSGRITAIRGSVMQSFGAYLTPNAPSGLLNRMGPLLPQAYTVGAIDVELTAVFANTAPLGPYRGAGRPEAAYFCERLVDLAATDTGLGPVEIRRRNYIPSADFPYKTCTGALYDSGNYAAALDRAVELADWAGFDAERRRASDDGRLLGIGLASFVEPGGIMPGPRGDEATVTIDGEGKVTVAVGTSSHGQGHETAFAQLAADTLGVLYEDVTVVFGDTDTAPFGYGTFGSRSAVAGGSAVYAACQQLLEAAKRVDAPMPLAEAAARMKGAGGVGGGLTATAAGEVAGVTYASGSYVAVVEIDPDTGRVTVLKVVAVDDCGRVINPLLVEGQVHGAIAQGLGQALCEEIIYDEEGQPMSASLMDYAVPFAASMPEIVSDRIETPSPFNPIGVKGMGESGTIGVTPAVVNAVMDALRPYGVRHLDMPLTAEKIWIAIHGRHP
jgi:carbon-monoxide dehydrogenase large subunit